MIKVNLTNWNLDKGGKRDTRTKKKELKIEEKKGPREETNHMKFFNNNLRTGLDKNMSRNFVQKTCQFFNKSTTVLPDPSRS